MAKKVVVRRDYVSLSGAKRAEKTAKRWGLETEIKREKHSLTGRTIYVLVVRG